MKAHFFCLTRIAIFVGLTIASIRLADGTTEVTSGPSILANYSGLSFSQSGGFVPPDTCGAAGPSNYVETVNQTIAIYSPKATGASAATSSFSTFWFTTGKLPHV